MSVKMLVGCIHRELNGTAPPAISQEAAESTQDFEDPKPHSQHSQHTQHSQSGQSYTKPDSTSGKDITEDGQYNSKDEVARYIKAFGHLPSNYVTKKAAREAGWSGGSLEEYFPGCSIGGDVFRNREGQLPKASGRTYYECDIDSRGRNSRGAKRIVYSNDGLIYYSNNHYKSFTLLYGKEN